MTQPEALRHADKLDAHEFDEPHGAAAELRRLAAVEDEWMALSQDQGKLEGQIDRLVAQRDALLAERDHARDQFGRAVKLLTSIHSCMYPRAVKMEDGRLMVFRPENPHEYLQALSDRIRALPDEIAAIKQAEGETK